MFFKWFKGKEKDIESFSLSTYVDKELPEKFSSSEDALSYLKHILKVTDYEEVVKRIWDDFCLAKGYSVDKSGLSQFDTDDEAGVPLNFTDVSEKHIKEYIDLIKSMFGVEEVYVINMSPSHSVRMISFDLDKYFNPFELNYKK